jgi:hypothetical protein
MDWFRWWHGTVTDPKFQWVARRCKQPAANVVSVWACLLECASNATQCNADATRGNVASFDCNVIDVLLGLDDGSVKAIFDAMTEKGLIENGRLTMWDARQPKREDSGNPNTGALSSTERSRLHREKVKREATHATEMQRNATHGNDREDKSREEIKEANASVDSNANASSVDLLGDGIQEEIDRTEGALHCPVARIVSAYHELMPKNPRVKVLSDKRKRSIAARWRDAASLDCEPFGYSTVADGLKAWKEFFVVCSESDFLTGRGRPRPGQPPFLADIDFLMSPDGFAKCIENKYHREVNEQ